MTTDRPGDPPASTTPGPDVPADTAPGGITADAKGDATPAVAAAPPPPRPGLNTFTIEGRAAPGLFVVGWLASILGLGIVVIGALAPSGLFVYLLGPTVLTIGLVAGAGNQAIERRARGEAYAGPSPYLVFVAMIAATFAVSFAVGAVLNGLIGTADVPDYVIALIGIGLQAIVFFGILRLTVVGSDALSWREMGWSRLDSSAARDLLVGAALALPVIGLTSVLAAVLVSIFRTVPESPLPPTGVAVGFVIQLIAGAVIAPLAEEGVFRGFAITAWRRTVGGRGAVVRASLLFALAHVLTVGGSNLSQAGGLFVVGFATRLPVAFALGWLFLQRRTIWAPLGLHMAFNAILLVLAEVEIRSGTPGA